MSISMREVRAPETTSPTSPTSPLDLRCPRCRAPLERDDARQVCTGCEEVFPSLGGVPDLRVFDDPFLDRAEDAERAELVRRWSEDRSLADVLKAYWSKSDITPPHLRERFIAGALRAETAALRTVRLVGEALAISPREARVLDLGCGTGGFLAAASEQFAETIGVDIAMRWLQVSRKRIRERRRREPQLVCACAEALPFGDASFDAIVLSSTLEFSRDPVAVLAECARVLRPGGAVLIQTVNRYSLAGNPYCGVWGVGFLPRRWQPWVIRRISGAACDPIRLRSRRELGKLVGRSFTRQDFRLPDVDDALLGELPAGTRRLAAVYRLMARMPVSRSCLQLFGPGWDVVLRSPLTSQPARNPTQSRRSADGEARRSRPMTHLSGLLSVIVLAPEAGESMARCVDGLMKDCEDPPLEILVVARRLTPALERLEQKQGMRVRAVICGEASLPRMRAVGVREARGAWVAFLSEWSEPSRGWLGALREGLLGGAYAVGGEVENGAGNRCVDWAVHFLEYAAFAPPLPAGPAPRGPGNNAAFRRELLQEVLNSEEAAEEWDWMWQARLREQGVEFRTAPGMTVLQRRRFRFVEFCRQRYWYSRSVAALRLRGRGGLSRIVYAAAATQLPALLWWRHARTMLSRRWSHGDARARRGLWRRWLTAMPWIVVFLFAGAWGEFCGALFGDGGSREKIPW